MADGPKKAESSTSAFRQIRGNVEEDLQQQLTVVPGASPRGFDVVLTTRSTDYSGKSLANYVFEELGIMGQGKEVVFEETDYRASLVHPPDEDNPVLLIEFGLKAGLSERNLMWNARALELAFDEFSALGQPIRDALGRAPETLWIPTVATKSDNHGHEYAAGLIGQALSRSIYSPTSIVRFASIVIAPPVDVNPSKIEQIVISLRAGLGFAAQPKDGAAESETPEANSTQDPGEFSKREILQGILDAVEQIDDEDERANAVGSLQDEMPDQLHADTAVDGEDGDDLGRILIATNIAENIRKVWVEHHQEKSRPFAVHLSGRWGSGKSSILNLLRDKLENDKSYGDPSPGTTRATDKKGWIVIDYNAWRMQDAGPAWWSLLNAVTEQGFGELGARGLWLRTRDRYWRNSQVARPWVLVLAAILLILALYLAFAATPNAETPLLGQLIAAASALGGITALYRFLQGFTKTSQETAEAVRNLQQDPMARMKARYLNVVEQIGQPVAVFIDDLDRCDARFVVELLQSLQTAYANVPVLYVVAADRDWIVSAYNQVYEDFAPDMSEPGQPLGYLFVKKIFQLSINVPDLTVQDSEALTNALLGRGQRAVSEEEEAEVVRGFQQEIDAADGDIETLQDIGFRAKGSVAAKKVAEALVAEVVDTPAQTQIKHALLEKVDLFDGNPRFIKRLINALTFRQSYILMAGERIPFFVTARWSILALRFPYTADYLAQNPDKVLPGNRIPPDLNGPSPDDEYFHDDAIDDILNDPEMTPEMIAKVSAFG